MARDVSRTPRPASVDATVLVGVIDPRLRTAATGRGASPQSPNPELQPLNQARSEAQSSEKRRAAVDEERMGLQDEIEGLVREKTLLETERARMREEMKHLEMRLLDRGDDASR